MIPLRDIIPSRTTPYVTIALVAINALAWFYEISMPERTLQSFLSTYGVVPARFEASTLFTSMFLHGSWMHVIGNMWYLWIFGDNVEDRLGSVLFLFFYLAAGVAAALLHALSHIDSRVPTLGASGAIAGVLGAYFLLLPGAKVLTLIFLGIIFFMQEIPAIFYLAFWFAFQAWQGGWSILHPEANGGVAFFAHIGGFGFGILTVQLVKKRNPLRPQY
jgi:rhomboid family protein